MCINTNKLKDIDDMIKSMTGFGCAERSDDNIKLAIEMKSVNHRYLDINVKLPRKFNYFEAQIRNMLKKYIERGKVDIFITYENRKEVETGLTYNKSLAKKYVDYYNQMEKELGISNNISTSVIGRCPEVFTMQDQPDDEEELIELFTQVFDEAAFKFVQSREIEGNHLRQDMLDKLGTMKSYVEFVELRSPEIVSEYRSRISDKVRELLENSQIDENRIVTEVTLFSDKVCVDEEIVRLNSHIEAMKVTIQNGGAVGRKLDFLAQEMNREANTIMSKSNDLSITDIGIELKTLIEKIREQIQNIE